MIRLVNERVAMWFGIFAHIRPGNPYFLANSWSELIEALAITVR